MFFLNNFQQSLRHKEKKNIFLNKDIYIFLVSFFYTRWTRRVPVRLLLQDMSSYGMAQNHGPTSTLVVNIWRLQQRRLPTQCTAARSG